ncbi:MAG TPA: hypothetical protein VGB42_05155 [Candidatus Thermoplasmatota archaeon]
MVEITAKAKKIGGSIFVPIPARVAREEGIRDGKEVRIIVVATGRRSKGVLGLFPQLTEFRRTERLWDD